MSLWIAVTDAGNGGPIIDAVFGTSTGNVSANNFGNGWYYVHLDRNVYFVCRDTRDCYYSAASYTDGYPSMYMSLTKKRGWPDC